MSEIRILGKLPDGKEIRGFEIEFETDKENWSNYRLLDGTNLRVKHTMLKTFRLVDEDGKPLFDENGEPQIFIDESVEVVASKANSMEQTMEESDALWDKVFASSQDYLDKLADEIEEKYLAGLTEDFDPENDPDLQ